MNVALYYRDVKDNRFQITCEECAHHRFQIAVSNGEQKGKTKEDFRHLAGLSHCKTISKNHTISRYECDM